MVWRLGVKFCLTQPFMRIAGSLGQCLGEEISCHKVGAGAGGQKAAVPDQLHSTQIDFPVALYRIFHRISGLCKCWRV